MINWILQKNLTKPYILTAIKKALTPPNETWEEITVVPFSKALPLISNTDSFPIFYGSTTLMLTAYQNKNFRKGIFYNPAKFNMENYKKQWGTAVLNNDGFLIELDEISQLQSPPEKKWFIRPNHDSKLFSGKVTSFKELKTWSEKILALQLPDFNATTQIWLAPPKTIKKEWRLFIIDDKIVSASRYMLEEKLSESSTDIPKEMLEFADKKIKAYRLADIYAMDIAETLGQHKIIECNCFNATGFYQHDIEEIVKAVNRFIRLKFKK